MNNKGQTLILFLFLFPIVFLIFMAIYQVGTAELEKRKMEENIETIVQYGLDHWSEEDIKTQMIEMFQSNFPKVSEKSIEIELETGQVKMTVTKIYNILFLKEQKMRISYVGTNIDGKVQVVKE